MTTRRRVGRIQRAATIVPLAVLSAAWTANVAGLGATVPVLSAEQAPPTSLPDGTSVPSEAIEAPASVSSADEGSKGDDERIVAASSTNAIPSAALAAYQRAETVINAADKTCNITWQLVAAIGRVESNHGRFGGNVLDSDGVADPGIFGPPLDGRGAVSRIDDTDAGQYDDDKTFDRAVGPMQFIPSTWSVVGVDADGDGERNPQDVDDAALGTAVYLCSGDEDLSEVGGQRSAVFRYNNSESYVDLVLAIMNSYLDGDYSTVPDNTIAGDTIAPDPTPPTTAPPNPGGPSTGGPSDPSDPFDPGTSDPGDPDSPPTTPPSNPPTDPPNNGGNGGGGGQPDVDVPDLPGGIDEPVEDLLTQAQALLQCTRELGLTGLVGGLLGLNPQQQAALDKCIVRYTT